MTMQQLLTGVIEENDLKISNNEYILMFLLLATSGNMLFNIWEWTYVFVALFVFVLASIKHKPISNKMLLGMVASYILLFALQFIGLEKVSIPANINRLAKLYEGFLIMTVLGVKFRKAYLKVMYFLCIVSLICWFLNIVIGDLPGYEFDRYRTQLIYNYIPYFIASGSGLGLRNCGMFWEPGAFEGYINIALLLYVGEFKVFYKHYRKEFWFLTAALLSTQSTTGYIVFAVILLLTVINSMKHIFMKVCVCVIMVAVSFFAFTTLDFMQNKILTEFEEAQYISDGDISWTRMGSAIIGWQNVKRHPLIGNGDLLESRYGAMGEMMNGSGNGFFGQMNVLGIPMMILILFLIYRHYPYSPYYKVVFLLVIVLLLQGEDFLSYPLFTCLMFIKYPNKTNGNNSSFAYSAQSA